MKTEARSFIHFGAVQLTVVGTKGEKFVLVRVTSVAPGTHEELMDPAREPFEIPMWENELKLFLDGNELVYEALPKKVGLEVGDIVHAMINYNDRLQWICVFGVTRDSDYIRITERLSTESLLRKHAQWNRSKSNPINGGKETVPRLQKPVRKAAATGSTDTGVASAGYNLAQAFEADGGPQRADVASAEKVPDIRGGLRHHQPAPRRHRQQAHRHSAAA